ncbi:MAG: NUDIX hydrolase [Chlorobiaceae bacterium]|nr:NUDIX hydrolase [Chlorobiaceae bacterium]NTW73517.1 NUDIX hydrolase [Chlorobiaceae bacterium]
MAYGSERIFQQSGVLPLFGDSVVLITTRRSGRWVIPKGHVEKGMSPADSATKEALEEAGLTGRIAGKELGTYCYRRPSGLYSVMVFPFEVDSMLDDWHEMQFRQRQMVSPAEAIGMIMHEQLRDLLDGYFAARQGG